MVRVYMVKNADERSNAATVRTLVQPTVPGGREADEPARAVDQGKLRLHEFFDRDVWTSDEAMWLLALGEHPPPARSKLLGAVRRALRDPSWEGELPEDVDAMVKLALFGRGQHGITVWPTFRHHWIRFAVQCRIPIATQFWLEYGTWKDARWADGHEIAYLMESEDTARRQKRSRKGFGPIPAEAIWTFPLDYEQDVAAEESVGPLRFLFARPGSSVDQLVRAVEISRNTYETRRTSIATQVSLIRRVGAENLKLIEDAVKRLAAARGVQPEMSGRYYFGLHKPELVPLLLRISPELKSLSADRLNRALTRFVRGRYGRPPE